MTKQFHSHRKTGWGQVSKWYDQLVGDEGSEYHREVIFPSLLNILNPKKGEHILDLGCGQGVFCRILEKFEVHATGVDVSEKLIRLAQERSQEQSSICYHVSPAHHLKDIPDESLDAVVSILAIQNMDSLSAIVQEISRTAKKKARLFWVLNHPCFRIPKQSHWGFDEKNKLQYRRMEGYLTPLKIPIQMHPGSDPDLVTWSFHRPLSSYMRVFHQYGWGLTHLEEWISHKKSEPGPRSRAENQARLEIPLFLMLGAVKM